MTWMNTLSNTQFDIFDPEPSNVSIHDIAHALSNVCRYSGQCMFFYSVAEHSLLMSKLAPSDLKLFALLHDAAEAYMGDMIRPHKKIFTDFVTVEKHLIRAIFQAFGIEAFLDNVEAKAEIKRLDNILLASEKRVLFPNTSLDWGLTEPEDSNITIRGLSPNLIHVRFLATFASLTIHKLYTSE